MLLPWGALLVVEFTIGSSTPTGEGGTSLGPLLALVPANGRPKLSVGWKREVK